MDTIHLTILIGMTIDSIGSRISIMAISGSGVRVILIGALLSSSSIHVVSIHIIRLLCHTWRLAIGPTEWLGLWRRNWFVDTCFGRWWRQWLVVRIPVFIIDRK